ncbi:hypothetical protein BGZ79_007264 [Entomortierella chlamydospora]|nr:hypothetical protein BGZ79_007264 [Entomortierella chlamydospora]
MWFLVGQERIAGLRIWLKPEVTLTVGRQISGNLGIGDISVGRRHVAITMAKPTMQSVRVQGEHTKLFIRDLSSKYGVFVNGKRIEPAKDVEVIIEENQTWAKQDKRYVAGRGYGGFVTIVIGEKTSFRLERVDWSLCSQGLTALAKVGIVSTAAEIDCKVEEAWTPGVSTHLVVGKSKRSEKLSLALAEGGHLVNVAWLKAVETSFKESWDSKGQKDARTMETDFPASVPDAFEISNVQWTPNALRRSLLSDYCFISVANVKYKGLSQVIRCAGGNWKKIDAIDALKSINECLVATVMPVFLYPHGEDDVAKVYSQLDTVLSKMGYRWVHEDEIGMAILYASTDIYCNPKYLDPLPTLEAMASLQSSQFMPSQYSGRPDTQLSISAPSTLSRSGLTAGGDKDDPQIIDDDTEVIEASFGLSQLMLPPRKSVKPALANPANANETTVPRVSGLASGAKPVKKKAKIDRMAMFLDGLDDDSIVDLNPVEPTDSLEASRNIVPSSIPTPVSVLATDPVQGHSVPPSRSAALNLATEKETVSEKGAKTKGSNNSEGEPRLGAPPSNRKAPKVITNKASPQELTAADESLDKGLSQEKSSQRPASFSTIGARKKIIPFDGVKEDMLALKLDVKVGRQKESIDEKERLRKLEVQRQQEKSKDAAGKLMQSEWSERLVINSKRRKLSEIQSASQIPPGSQASSDGCPTDVQVLSEVDQKNWPERWKNLPNFKIQDSADSVLHEKWKNVPNFKTFRKSTKAGIHVKPRLPVAMMLDGVTKQGKATHKNGDHLKTEPQDSPIPLPLPKRRVGEAQMAREDLQLLLADN